MEHGGCAMERRRRVMERDRGAMERSRGTSQRRGCVMKHSRKTMEHWLRAGSAPARSLLEPGRGGKMSLWPRYRSSGR